MLIIVISIIGKLFEYLLFDDRGTKSLQNGLYRQESIDTLFIGSSHVRQAINTEIIDNKLNVKSYNLGTSSQNYDGSYAILREADSLYDIKIVYLDTYYVMGQMEDKEDRTQLSSTYIIGDYIRKCSPNRWNFLLEASSKNYWINGFFPARREWRTLFNKKEISKIVEGKERIEDNIDNNTKGYTENNGTNDLGSIISTERYAAIPEKFITDECKDDIKKIINYCKKHEIDLAFINIPIPDFRLNQVGNYDYYVSEMRKFCEENEVVYYDFNLCKREYFSSKDDLFYDDHHLNGNGAKKFCNLFADLINGKVKSSDIFFDSYKEKTIEDEFQVLGAYLDISDDSMILEVIDNGKADVQYRFINGENNEEISDFSKIRKINVPKDCETVEVEYKLSNKLDYVEKIIYEIE